MTTVTPTKQKKILTLEFINDHQQITDPILILFKLHTSFLVNVWFWELIKHTWCSVKFGKIFRSQLILLRDIYVQRQVNKESWTSWGPRPGLNRGHSWGTGSTGGVNTIPQRRPAVPNHGKHWRIIGANTWSMEGARRGAGSCFHLHDKETINVFMLCRACLLITWYTYLKTCHFKLTLITSNENWPLRVTPQSLFKACEKYLCLR